MYKPTRIDIPEKVREKLKNYVIKDKPFSIKVNLEKEGDDTLLLTRAQIAKIERSRLVGKKSVSVRLSRKQIRENIKHEGGFLATLAGLAARALPTILGGLASGLLSGAMEKAVDGDGLFVYKNKQSARIQPVKGGGLFLTPFPQPHGHGVYIRHGNEVYNGEGLLLGPNSPFKDIPLLNLLL